MLTGKPHGMRRIRRVWLRLENNIKMRLEARVREYVGWIQLVQNRAYTFEFHKGRRFFFHYMSDYYFLKNITP
jgi:hypothetical protein